MSTAVVNTDNNNPSNEPLSNEQSVSSKQTVSNEQVNLELQENTQLVDNVKDLVLQQLKESLLQEIGERTVDKPYLLTLMVKAMELVEASQVKGADQKQLVIDALIMVLKLPDVKVPSEELLVQFLENDASDVIELVVDASKGKVNINKVESFVTRFIKMLFACLKKKE